MSSEATFENINAASVQEGYNTIIKFRYHNPACWMAHQ
jgi:hypothetical protein